MYDEWWAIITLMLKECPIDVLVQPWANILDLKLNDDDDGPKLYKVNKVDDIFTLYWKYISVWVDPR